MIDSSPRFLEVLTEIVELSPDVRIGQMVAFFNDLIEANTGRSTWDAEDDDVLVVLEQHLVDLRRVLQPAE